MSTFSKPIVVGIDGSAAADHALRWAVSEGAAHHVPVHAIIAWRWNGPDLDGDLTEQAAREEAHHVLDAVLERVADGLTVVQSQLIEGSPTRVLVAASHDASLLVVGNNRHGGAYRALIGSVADGCLRAAACPVVLVSAGSQPPTADT